MVEVDGLEVLMHKSQLMVTPATTFYYFEYITNWHGDPHLTLGSPLICTIENLFVGVFWLSIMESGPRIRREMKNSIRKYFYLFF